GSIPPDDNPAQIIHVDGVEAEAKLIPIGLYVFLRDAVETAVPLSCDGKDSIQLRTPDKCKGAQHFNRIQAAQRLPGSGFCFFSRQFFVLKPIPFNRYNFYSLDLSI